MRTAYKLAIRTDESKTRVRRNLNRRDTVPKSRIFLVVTASLLAMLLVAPLAYAKAQRAKTKTEVIKSLEQQKFKSQTVLKFWNGRGQWALHQKYEKCWQVRGKKRKRVCKNARQSLKLHSQRLEAVELKLNKLTAPRNTGYLPPEQARELGRKMASLKGWTGQQWECLDSLWGGHESSWRVRVWNYEGSGAYGIPQAKPGYKMGEGWQDSAYVQIKWGLGYIAGRYGTPCVALAFRKANGWY